MFVNGRAASKVSGLGSEVALVAEGGDAAEKDFDSAICGTWCMARELCDDCQCLEHVERKAGKVCVLLTMSRKLDLVERQTSLAAP